MVVFVAFLIFVLDMFAYTMTFTALGLLKIANVLNKFGMKLGNSD